MHVPYNAYLIGVLQWSILWEFCSCSNGCCVFFLSFSFSSYLFPMRAFDTRFYDNTRCDIRAYPTRWSCITLTGQSGCTPVLCDSMSFQSSLLCDYAGSSRCLPWMTVSCVMQRAGYLVLFPF
ncbi:hypothetical protein BDV41DRAFT_263875 [Aspergillus transmontanensis]|uniref:Uncharacterized protein n=1 Tax=Aspergillus transmontanensis TaxID=1034304 RepID=A0A5N6VYI9_9EURO|nr:hypothetical protein BDV41DRAFT_263875 [Aspergillus transmontanensis]